MDEIIRSQSENEVIEVVRSDADLVEMTEGILADTRTDILKVNAISMPIDKLSTLGAGVGSLLEPLRTVTQTATVDGQGLYRLANESIGDTLKVAKNGNFWGAFNKAGGGSKFVQLQAAAPQTVVTKTVMPIDPATMMMAVALYSIEQQMGTIIELEKKILSFLEIEKESQIEADVETLTKIVEKYKQNWDNEYFVASNHKMVLDIQRKAKENMISFQKRVSEKVQPKKRLTSHGQVNSVLKDMQKEFRYYRLSLYTYAMASFIEIMLSGNFKEENIAIAVTDVEKQSYAYRELFLKGSAYLEKISEASVGTNVLKGVGSASKAVGKFIGNIPLVSKGPVDEFLQDGGDQLRNNAHEMEQNVLSEFAEISNPGTAVFLAKMRDMIQIYNYTSEICFDNKKIYLIS